MTSLLEQLGAQVRRYRAAANMSQGELALTAELTNGYLSDLERGKVNISLTNLHKISTALRVPLPILLDCGDSDREKLLSDLAELLPWLPDDALESLFRIGLFAIRQKP